MDDKTAVEVLLRHFSNSTESNPKQRSTPETEDRSSSSGSSKGKKTDGKPQTKNQKLQETLIDHLKENRKERARLENKMQKNHNEKMALLREIMGLPPKAPQQEVPTNEFNNEESESDTE